SQEPVEDVELELIGDDYRNEKDDQAKADLPGARAFGEQQKAIDQPPYRQDVDHDQVVESLERVPNLDVGHRSCYETGLESRVKSRSLVPRDDGSGGFFSVVTRQIPFAVRNCPPDRAECWSKYITPMHRVQGDSEERNLPAR